MYYRIAVNFGNVKHSIKIRTLEISLDSVYMNDYKNNYTYGNDYDYHDIDSINN